MSDSEKDDLVDRLKKEEIGDLRNEDKAASELFREKIKRDKTQHTDSKEESSP